MGRRPWKKPKKPGSVLPRRGIRNIQSSVRVGGGSGPGAGEKELLGLWVSAPEGAPFCLTVFTELQQCRMKDCFVACVDSLAGLPDTLEAIFPQTQVQLCIVHQLPQTLLNRLL